jgi:hypothetical protein
MQEMEAQAVDNLLVVDQQETIHEVLEQLDKAMMVEHTLKLLTILQVEVEVLVLMVLTLLLPLQVVMVV